MSPGSVLKRPMGKVSTPKETKYCLNLKKKHGSKRDAKVSQYGGFGLSSAKTTDLPYLVL